jgi:predicted HTH domain antitoxin
MAVVSFEIPDRVIDGRFLSPEAFACALRLAAAIEWYRRGEVSHGRAAEIAGLSRAQFIDALAAAGEQAYTLEPDELDQQLAILAQRRHDAAPE